MRFKINHVTRYTYSHAVFLEPHLVRLRPRVDASQCLPRYHLAVTPTPAGQSEGLDPENNSFSLLWFDGLHDRLEIRVSAEVDTFRTNPHEGLLVDGADRLPFSIPPHQAIPLRPYLSLEASDDDQELLRTLTRDLMDKAQGRTQDFLTQLNNWLYQSTEKVTRFEPGMQSPHETLSSKRGACRDLTLLFLAVCRRVGIPARFVSGYQQGDPDIPDSDLHAWAEVFLPGFGWRGYDPTHGLAVADRHIALAAAALLPNAAPVTGTFRGTDVKAVIEHMITMH
jgi:transglutaminase-like putative cysteine protease